MTNVHKRRAARRKLAAHDRGENRHNKGLGWIMKQNRIREARNLTQQALAAAQRAEIGASLDT